MSDFILYNISYLKQNVKETFIQMIVMFHSTLLSSSGWKLVSIQELVHEDTQKQDNSNYELKHWKLLYHWIRQN